MLAPDTINEINVEEKQYRRWEQEKVNSILKLTDCKRKRELYQKHFPTMTRSDDYLVGNIF